MIFPAGFEKISLTALNLKAPLLNREDRKFILPISKLRTALNACADQYYLLDIRGESLFRYHNWYFDTACLRFYREHHSGKTSRIKVRKRAYLNNGESFIEVKQKTNKGNTVKYRKACNQVDEAGDFIRQHAGYELQDLRETLQIRYHRITLLHKDKPEKVTLDLDLCYNGNGITTNYENLVIAEVKTEKCDTPSFSHIMKGMGVREGSLSKYCLGIISTELPVKHNNFKQQYLQILKINRHGIILQS